MELEERYAREHGLQEMHRGLSNDRALSHLRNKAKHLVKGEGPLPAEIMLIGEAPGEMEDDTGKPFVGAAGKVLDLLIRRANLKREYIYITNVVKYRPIDGMGRNRTPTDREVEISLMYLEREIRIVAPRVIGLMGKTAIQAFFKSRTPGRDHGTVWRADKHSRPIVFLYHPAFAVYSKQYLQTLIDDFRVIPETLKEQSGADGSSGVTG